MKDLGNLSPADGSKIDSRRIGRGPGSGLGKTAGKGHKGQKARKGSGPAWGFEGGQTPLYRRLPKYGFSRRGKQVEYQLVTLTNLDSFEDGQEITKALLQERGFIKSSKKLVKVLATGEVSKKLVLQIDRISKKAKEAVEAAGGSIQGVK